MSGVASSIDDVPDGVNAEEVKRYQLFLTPYFSMEVFPRKHLLLPAVLLELFSI